MIATATDFEIVILYVTEERNNSLIKLQFTHSHGVTIIILRVQVPIITGDTQT